MRSVTEISIARARIFFGRARPTCPFLIFLSDATLTFGVSNVATSGNGGILAFREIEDSPIVNAPSLTR
jgi:hypothetical protein